MSGVVIGRLDYFAAHAPAEIPDWFVHKPPAQKFPPMPDYSTLETEEHRRIALDWQHDPCFDLPEELAWYQKKVQEHRAGKGEWTRQNAIARFFQWRWSYATTMIAEGLFW